MAAKLTIKFEIGDIVGGREIVSEVFYKEGTSGKRRQYLVKCTCGNINAVDASSLGGKRVSACCVDCSRRKSYHPESSKYLVDIMKLNLLGMNSAEIAKKLNIPYWTVRHYLDKNEIKSPRSPSVVRLNNNDSICDKCTRTKESDDFKSGNLQLKPNCRDCYNFRRREKRSETLEYHLKYTLSALKSKAKTKNIPFNISLDMLIDIYNLQSGKCFYTDRHLGISCTKGRPTDDSLSVDKIVPELGYTYGNIVICCWKSNRIKSNLTLEELQEWMPLWYNRLLSSDLVNKKLWI